MQYPVPQFTEVEDKLIGPLSLRQFLIVGGAGLVVFLLYTATKSIALLIGSGLVLGIPAIGIAFMKVNGIAIYKMVPSLLRHFFSIKTYIFHRSAEISSVVKVTTEEKTKAEAPVTAGKASRLKDLNLLLQSKVLEEKIVAENVDKFTPKKASISDLFK